MFSVKRRLILKTSCSYGLAVLSSLFIDRTCAAWPADHFSPSPYNETLNRLFNNRPLVDSDLIKISLPQTAENGAVVPITISSDLDNIQRLYILVEKNPTPLAAEFILSAQLSVYITARIKMAESSKVVIIAEQDGQLLRSQQWVNVVLGGCGSG